MDEARERWLAAADEIYAPGPRNAYNAIRWLVRRRTIGDLRTIGLAPVVRILRAMRGIIRERRPFPPALKRDWEVFN